MQVALLTEFVATRKEPLAVLLERIHAAFLASDLGEPSILFAFSDSPVPGGRSTIDRLLKKYPDFARFTGEHCGIPNVPPVRQVSNRPGSTGAGESVPFATLLAVAAGVPRSCRSTACRFTFTRRPSAFNFRSATWRRSIPA